MTAVKSMKQSDIRHVALVVPTFGEESKSLAAEAADVLGYDALRQYQTEGVEKIGKLSRVLADLGIDTLNKDDVKKYQREKQNEVARQKFEEWVNDTAAYRSNFWGPGWTSRKINEYKEPVPEFVLNKALQIKKALPDVVIEVEYLEEHPDPFMKVKLLKEGSQYTAEEEFYVEVWEEPTFESRL